MSSCEPGRGGGRRRRRPEEPSREGAVTQKHIHVRPHTRKQRERNKKETDIQGEIEQGYTTPAKSAHAHVRKMGGGGGSASFLYAIKEGKHTTKDEEQKPEKKGVHVHDCRCASCMRMKRSGCACEAPCQERTQIRRLCCGCPRCFFLWLLSAFPRAFVCCCVGLIGFAQTRERAADACRPATPHDLACLLAQKQTTDFTSTTRS